jgi:pimeloyl-ACP methyl ester carboxylesterase
LIYGRNNCVQEWRSFDVSAMVRAPFSEAQMTLPAFKSEESRARFIAAYDAALAEWPGPFEEIDVPTRLGPTHVVASGAADAPPLLLLPSFAGTAAVWRLNAEGLSRHFRLYAVDVVGQPGKSLARRALRNRDYAPWLSDLMDGLGVSRASVVGCSFGAFLALNQALATPERIERVVLISPAGTFASQYWRLFYAMRVRPPFLRLIRRLTGATRAPSLADMGPRRLPRDRKWAALIGVTMAERAKVSVTNPTVFSRGQLRAVRAPTLLLIGDKETLYEPRAMLQLAQARMAGLQGAIVPDADHIAAMAQPDDVNARIVAFLQP